MGILGTYKQKQISILQPEPPTNGGENGEDEDEPKKPQPLTDEEIDDIIEKAKSNGFDGIDEEAVIDEDEDDVPPPPEEDEEEKGGEDEEGEGEEGEEEEGEEDEEGEGEEGEEEEGEEDEEGEKEGEGEEDEEGEKEGEEEEGEEEEGEEEGKKPPTFEKEVIETKEDKERRLKVRYAQLMSKMQNSQKYLAETVNKYGEKIPTRIKKGMGETASTIQKQKDINVYED